MPTRTLGPEGGRLRSSTSIGEGKSVSENARPRRAVDCEILLGEENESFFIRV